MFPGDLEVLLVQLENAASVLLKKKRKKRHKTFEGIYID